MWGHPNIIRKRQAGLQSEAPTQTAQVHIAALLSPSQIPTSFQASIFTDLQMSSPPVGYQVPYFQLHSGLTDPAHPSDFSSD